MNDADRWAARVLKANNQSITYRLYQNPEVTNGRRLVLLHGAGVAGIDTWSYIARMLDQWQEILIPDLRGMGDTRALNHEEEAFSDEDLVADLSALVDYLGWWMFDLGGYSMGGMVAMLYKQKYASRVGKQFLLESALLDRPTWDATVEIRQKYSEATQYLRGNDKEVGILAFMNTISPNRRISPQVEALSMSRLGHRPVGFANALDCVTATINKVDRPSLIAAQGDVTSFIGGLSVDAMHQYHQYLDNSLPNWHYFKVPGTDHSLPYQKPRSIAKKMNAEAFRFYTS